VQREGENVRMIESAIEKELGGTCGGD